MLGHLLRTSQIKRAVRAERRHHGSQQVPKRALTSIPVVLTGGQDYPVVGPIYASRGGWSEPDAGRAGLPTRR